MKKKYAKLIEYAAWTMGIIAICLLLYGILKNLGVFS